MRTRSTIALLFGAAIAGCASTPTAVEDLALYRAHAGAPVASFLRRGAFTQWTPLGEDALAVWTSPSRGYLLDVTHCPDLPWAHGIRIGDAMGQVSARFDSVLPLGPGRTGVPCRIEQIRPLDAKALRAAQRQARQQRQG